MATTKITTKSLADASVTSAKLASNLSITGNFTVDTNTLFIDSINDRVGVGTLSASAKLHVLSTAEQFRIGYNATNATKFIMASANQLTVTPLINSTTFFNFTDAAGTSILNLDSTNDRVGIGTTTPAGTLEVYSSGGGTGGLRASGGGGGTYFWLMAGNQPNATIAKVGIYASAGNFNRGNMHFLVDTSSDGNIANPTDDTKMMIDYTTGNVGIGTSSPSAKLHILQTTEQLRLGYDVSNYMRFVVSSSGVLQTFINGSSTYSHQFGGGNNEIRIRNGEVTLTSSGAEFTIGSSYITRLNSSAGFYTTGNVGAGTGSTISARLHTISTTEQFRSGYDSSNYWNATTNSTGVTTLSAAGTDASFVFSKGVSFPYVAKTATYTITNSDHTVNCTANSFTVTLPTAVGIVGRQYIIKNSGTGIITINTTSSQTIDGQASGSLTLNNPDALTVMSDGANWIII